MPLACGMPPTPAGCSMSRLLSVMANWPSRKKPSRGVVATQFGLPRPAFRNADCVVFDVALGQVDQLVLDLERAQSLEFLQRHKVGHDFLLFLRDSVDGGVMKGKSMSTASRAHAHQDFSPLGQQNDQHHSPDRQQRVPDRVGHRVTEPGNLTLGTVIDHAERGCCRARTGASSQHNGVVEPE